MTQYSAPRGTQDILPMETPRWQFVEEKFRGMCHLHGYHELRTPTFEETELFTRSIGEHTDIVSKEMYTFPDRAGRSMTLRAEGTAPVVRAYLQHKLYGIQTVSKFYYITSVFRYERPQAGRFREHHQVGVEALGSQDPAIDAEVIALGTQYLAALGIGGTELRVNSVGCPKCAPHYKDVLRKAVEPFLADMCETCLVRYNTNPLRILDCKVPQCRTVMQSVPGICDHLCEECADHFGNVLRYLDKLGIRYTLDPKLVRGLDYYTKTAFEIVSKELGAQNTVIGGGRYDGLVEEMGGPPTPAVGFGSGIERTLLIMEAQNIGIPAPLRATVFLATLGDEPRRAGIRLLAELRKAGISAETDYSGKSLKAQMRAADREGADLVVIVGEEELNRGMAKIRDMRSKEERDIPLDEATDHIVATHNECTESGMLRDS